MTHISTLFDTWTASDGDKNLTHQTRVPRRQHHPSLIIINCQDSGSAVFVVGKLQVLTARANWNTEPIRGRRRLMALTLMGIIKLADLQRHSLNRSTANMRWSMEGWHPERKPFSMLGVYDSTVTKSFYLCSRDSLYSARIQKMDSRTVKDLCTIGKEVQVHPI